MVVAVIGFDAGPLNLAETGRALGAVQGEPDLGIPESIHPAQLHPGLKAPVRPGGDLEVPDVPLRLGEQGDRPEDARQMPIVLIFQPGGVGEAHDLKGDAVFPRTHEGGDVKVAHQLAVLGIAHRPAVDPKVIARLHPAQHQVQLHALKAFRQDKIPRVQPGGVVLGHKGRVVAAGIAGGFPGLGGDVVGALAVALKGIDHVGVDGPAIALGLPVAGHLDIAPAGQVKLIFVKGLHRLFRALQKAEFPGSIQADLPVGGRSVEAQGLLGALIRAPGGVGAHAVDGQHFRILPIGQEMKFIAHGDNSFQKNGWIVLPRCDNPLFTVFFCIPCNTAFHWPHPWRRSSGAARRGPSPRGTAAFYPWR